jgi:hypothetical protein
VIRLMWLLARAHPVRTLMGLVVEEVQEKIVPCRCDHALGHPTYRYMQAWQCEFSTLATGIVRFKLLIQLQN